MKSDFEGKVLLVVNTGWTKKKFILRIIKKLGVTVVCLNKEKNWAYPYVDHWVITDNANHVKALEDLENFIAGNPNVKINGVVTFWEDDVLLTSKIVDRFNFTGISFKIAKKARNKFLFRKFCQENGIRVPQYQLVKSRNDLTNVRENFKFPLVMKPTYGSSSAYVVKIETEEELLSTYQYIKDNMSATVESSLLDGMDILVEEYIDGEEVDVDIVLQNGKVKFHSISDNFQTREPFFVETGQAIPSSLPVSKQRELLSNAEEVLEKLGVQNGVIHFEAKSTPTGPVPIEVNLRMGGDEVHSFIHGAWGVDLVECAVNVALDNYIPRVERPEIPLKHINGVYFLSENSGVVSQLEIGEGLEQHPHLGEIHFFKKIGEPILVPPEGFESLGWVTATGENAIDAEDNLNDIVKKVKYEVAKFGQDSSMGRTLRKNRFSSAVLNKNLLMRAVKIEKVKEAMLKNLQNLHIGILGNRFNNDDAAALHAITGSVDQFIQQALTEKGYQKISVFDFNNPLQAAEEIKASSVDLVLNVCGKVNTLNLLESHAAAVLEVLQVPYTGSDPGTLNFCVDKIKVKKLLDYHKIPTPKWDYAYEMEDEIDENLRYPLIVKPPNTNNSIIFTN